MFEGMGLPIDKPKRMTIINPITRQPLRDAEGNEAYVDLYSADSPVLQAHNREVMRRRSGVRGKLTPEEQEANGTDALVALTVGWKLLNLDGSLIDLPFSPENARKLYEASAVRWLRDQVDDFAADRGNFAPPSSTTSSPGRSTSSGKVA